MSKEKILQEFETEYCNNHNHPISWLRGVLIDQEDQKLEMEKFLSHAIDQTREETIREVEKKFDYFVLLDWSGETEVYNEIERLKQSLINLRK